MIVHRKGFTGNWSKKWDYTKKQQFDIIFKIFLWISHGVTCGYNVDTSSSIISRKN